MRESHKRVVAEFLGTLLLVFFGVGSAIATLVQGGMVVVALSFGFVLVVLVYAFGPISGSHFNPAVTLGVLVIGRIGLRDAIAYWVAQLLGATVGSFILWGLVQWGGVIDQTGSIGATGYGTNINIGGAMVLEIILTFLFVLVVLVITSRAEYAGFAGPVIGIALAAVMLVGLTLDGGSVNPARSFGSALFAGTHALAQLWVFILFPLLGGLLAALAAPLIVSADGQNRHGPHTSADNPPPAHSGYPG